jgi:hypothetical protein
MHLQLAEGALSLIDIELDLISEREVIHLPQEFRHRSTEAQRVAI